ncbi:PREDICTED: cytochrome P450 2U1-like [Priapulus caudatus]|uniref:Cytochrome P450 2U1-like n=1 Tax=Priapulus caudatus TaxID=37621 RepID=A0ABM1EV12_PRICU|nr:PREDICTED: cytochrome P450 2U1-like [Priapulus caudatus]
MFHHYVPRWTAAHNFLSAALCGAGIGLYSLEECIKDELTFLTEQLSEVRGQSIDVCELFNKAAFNIVAVVCVGSRMWSRIASISTQAKVKCVESDSLPYLSQRNTRGRLTARTRSGDTSDEHLVQMIFDLMTGSRSAMTWFAVYVAAHADVQRKMQEEIERVVGHDRRVSLEDRPRMPYTMAVINESLRLGTPTPFSLPHAPIKDSTFRGFHLPKTCTVVANIWSVHHDEKEWPNPEVFNPDRWLDADGQLIQHKAFMPYSVGRRKCVAHWLADAQNFIFLTNILQNFTLGTSSSGVEEPKLLAGSPLREPTSASITVGTRAY